MGSGLYNLCNYNSFTAVSAGSISPLMACLNIYVDTFIGFLDERMKDLALPLTGLSLPLNNCYLIYDFYSPPHGELGLHRSIRMIKPHPVHGTWYDLLCFT